jgi:tight adherence protein B
VALTILAVTCGAGIGAGMVGLVRALRPTPHGRARRRGSTVRPHEGAGARWMLRIALGAAFATAAGLATRWPAAAVIAGSGGAGLPSVVEMRQRPGAKARIEAVAAWTELLRDTLAAASGLSQAIVTTAPMAPDPIGLEVRALAARLQNGAPTEEALRMFADDVADPSADMVVCALVLAASARAQRLVELLGALADSMRDEVAMRLKVDSARASARSGVRTVAFFSIGFAALLFVFAHSYLTPFGSFTGQLVLVVAAAFDASGIALMAYMVRERSSGRLLERREPLAPGPLTPIGASGTEARS